MNPTPPVKPLLKEDLPAAALFLHQQFQSCWSPAQWQELFLSCWDPQAPDLGRVAMVNGQVVGVIGAIYASLPINDRQERFCNIHSWFAAESHRNVSLPLLLSLIQDSTLHYTNFTANQPAYQSSRFVKFAHLETSYHILRNLPSPTMLLSPRFWIRRHLPEVLALLPPNSREIAEGLAKMPGVEQWAIENNGRVAHWIFQRTTWKKWSCAQILHAHPPESLNSLLLNVSSLMFFNRIAFMQIDSRMIDPPRSWRIERHDYSIPRLFLSRSLEPHHISNICTDRMVLDAIRRNLPPHVVPSKSVP